MYGLSFQETFLSLGVKTSVPVRSSKFGVLELRPVASYRSCILAKAEQYVTFLYLNCVGIVFSSSHGIYSLFVMGRLLVQLYYYGPIVAARLLRLDKISARLLQLLCTQDSCFNLN